VRLFAYSAVCLFIIIALCYSSSEA